MYLIHWKCYSSNNIMFSNISSNLYNVDFIQYKYLYVLWNLNINIFNNKEFTSLYIIYSANML
jgi:hypothetical protein